MDWIAVDGTAMAVDLTAVDGTAMAGCGPPWSGGHGRGTCGAHAGDSKNSKVVQEKPLICFLFFVVGVLNFNNDKKCPAAVFYTPGQLHGRDTTPTVPPLPTPTVPPPQKAALTLPPTTTMQTPAADSTSSLQTPAADGTSSLRMTAATDAEGTSSSPRMTAIN